MTRTLKIWCGALALGCVLFGCAQAEPEVQPQTIVQEQTAAEEALPEPVYETHEPYMSAENGFFEPEKPLTRAQAAQMVCTLAGLKEADAPDIFYADVAPENWYYAPVHTAAAYFEEAEKPAEEMTDEATEEADAQDTARYFRPRDTALAYELRDALRRALELSMSREARKKGKNGVSPFESLMTALASTVGTGNIVGVAAALVSGGPGALVWMELAALLGLAAKFAECMLAVKYRRSGQDGTRWGGPMAVMESCLGPLGRPMGKAFALFALLMAFAMGALAQSGALADTCFAAFHLPRWQAGAVASALTLVILLGGIRRIADVSAVLVPVMALVYIGGALAVILGNLSRLPEALAWMLRCAFAPEAALGGVLGTVTRRDAVRWGVARGIFSNEAGLGSAAITAACADTEDPVKQGLISMTGVFFDTTVICSLTGLAVCCSGVLGTMDGAGVPLTGAALTIRAFETVLGSGAGWLIGISLGLFAFTSILGCALQAETVTGYLLGSAAVRPCRILYGAAVWAGAVIPMGTVLQLADLVNVLMALPNLVCLMLLSGEIAAECRKAEL